MLYVTGVERKGVELGRTEGRMEMVREDLLDIFEARFD